jgi:hypothetical protein
MGETRNVYKILIGNPTGTNPLEDVGIKEGIMLTCILKKQSGRTWARSISFKKSFTGTLVNKLMNLKFP